MPKSAAFLILVLSPLNRVWQRVGSSSIRILLILCFNILKLDASQPPSYTLSFKIAQNFSIGRIWGELGGLLLFGINGMFRLFKRSVVS